MSRTALTWRNVAAPSFAGAAAAINTAGNLIESGFDGFGDAARSLASQKRDSVSQAAIAEALKYNTQEEFDNVIRQKGLAGFGVTDPSMLSDDAMKFFQGRRAKLADLASTNSLNEYRDVTTDWFDTNQNWQHDRRVEAHEAGLQNQELQNWAASEAQKLGGATFSKEEAGRKILAANLPPQQQAALISALDGGPDYWTASEAATGANALDPSIGGLTEDLSVLTSANGFETSTNPLLRLDGIGTELGTNASDMGLSIAKSLSDLNGVDEEILGTSAAKIATAISELSQEMGVSPEVAGGAIKQSLTARRWHSFNGNTLKIDKSGARDILNQISTAEGRNLLWTEAAQIKENQSKLQEYQRQSESIQQRIAIARDRKNQDEVQNGLNDLKALHKRIQDDPDMARLYGTRGADATGSGSATGNPTPADTVQDDPVAQLVRDAQAALNSTQSTEQRAQRKANAVHRVGKEVNDLISDVAQFLGKVPTAAAQYTNSLGSDAAGLVSSLFDAELGARHFAEADNTRRNISFVPESSSLPGSDIRNHRSRGAGSDVLYGGTDPSAVLASYAQEANEVSNDLGIAPSVAQEALASKAILESGVNPDTGERLTSQEKRQHLRIVSRLAQGAAQYYRRNPDETPPKSVSEMISEYVN